jgi:hypothetical protein
MSSVAERRADAADGIDQPETRDIRALSDAMLVLPERLTIPSDGVAPGMFLVQTTSEQYVVDPSLGACTCADAEYRAPDGGCKHVRRVRFETGARELPGWLDPDALGPGFRQFVSREDGDGGGGS